ncbi:hypothetical protein TNCV_2061931 [Trichonephila clavipes]|nr:hypothetical protein TNCV_2061931 [Trichonephila clavipes]
MIRVENLSIMNRPLLKGERSNGRERPGVLRPCVVAYLVCVFGALQPRELPNTGAVTNIGRLIASIRRKTRAFSVTAGAPVISEAPVRPRVVVNTPPENWVSLCASDQHSRDV